MANIKPKWEMAALLAVFALGLFFRFYLIAEIPPGLYPDEAANGNNAVEAFRTGSFKIFYPENNGREGLFINLQVLAIKFFGPHPWALRAVAAVFGTLTVLGLYLFAGELFRSSGRREAIALLSSFFLATSYWHINFSRIGFRAIMVPFFAVFGMYWLAKALRTGKISSAVLAGFSIGLGFYTYIAFRFMPFVIIVPLIAALWSWRTNRPGPRCVPCLIGLFLFATFITAVPIGLYFLQHPQDFFGRSGQVSIFSAPSPATEFIKSNVLTLGMLTVRGDCNQRHNLSCKPQVFWPVGIFFIIGLALALRNVLPRRKSEARRAKSEANSHWEFRASATLLAWLFFLALPSTLTREGLPHALRAIGMIPAVMIVAAMGAVTLRTALQARLEQWLENPQYEPYRAQLRRIRTELAFASLLFFIWIPMNAYRDYFVRFAYSDATPPAFASDLWQQGRYLNSLPQATKKFVLVNLAGDDIRGVPAPAQTVMFATDTFDEARRREKGLAYLTRLEDIPNIRGEKVIIVPMNPRDRELIAALRAKFPSFTKKAPGDFVIFHN